MNKITLNTHRNLNGLSSVYLDILRLCCALIVFFFHSIAQVWLLPGTFLSYFMHLPHFAVVMFFVLSGYVIAHTTSIKKRTLSEYAVARLSRLYSILIPALAVTAICLLLSFTINRKQLIYSGFYNDYPVVRFFLSLTFTNELWFISAAPRINNPLWSLGYEFWYYVLFGAVYFRNKANWKGWILPVIISLIIGPKILLMFPIWLMGWLSYHIISYTKLPVNLSRCLFVLLIVIAGVVAFHAANIPTNQGVFPLFFSYQFVSDWIAGFIVAIALVLLPTQKEKQFQQNNNLLKRFRILGNMTYPIYVLHMPLLVLCLCISGKLIKCVSGNYLSCWISMITVLFVCCVLALWFESKKTWWDRLFQKSVKKLTV